MNLLLTSIGKRIELIEHLKSRFRVVGVDASAENPAKHFVDAFYLVPKCRESGYVDDLLAICAKEEISLLVPLYEPEFAILDKARGRFEAAGVKLVLSDQKTLAICGDKRKTAVFFEKYGIPAPRTLLPQEVRDIVDGAEAAYPLVVKPADGMGSSGVYVAKNKKELAFFYEYVENAMVQECASGREYTIDALCDFDGTPIYIVPRIRLEVISGEVSKSRVDLRESVIEATRRLLAALRREGSVRGPMTVQCFWAEDGESPQFIEINPRFGGGVPLAFASGANYAAALEKMTECAPGGKEKMDLTTFQKKEMRELTMLRYTQAVYEA